MKSVDPWKKSSPDTEIITISVFPVGFKFISEDLGTRYTTSIGFAIKSSIDRTKRALHCCINSTEIENWKNIFQKEEFDYRVDSGFYLWSSSIFSMMNENVEVELEIDPNLKESVEVVYYASLDPVSMNAYLDGVTDEEGYRAWKHQLIGG